MKADAMTQFTAEFAELCAKHNLKTYSLVFAISGSEEIALAGNVHIDVSSDMPPGAAKHKLALGLSRAAVDNVTDLLHDVAGIHLSECPGLVNAMAQRVALEKGQAQAVAQMTQATQTAGARQGWGLGRPLDEN